MLTELRIGNFKAFGATQRIPIKPLTLIFGPNSSGKSSIIHALLLLHDTSQEQLLKVRTRLESYGKVFGFPGLTEAEIKTFDVHRPVLGDGSVDLGGFNEFVHKHQKQQRVELGLEFDPSDGGRLEISDDESAACAWVAKHCRQMGVVLRIGVAQPGTSYRWPERSQGGKSIRMVRRKITDNIPDWFVCVQECEIRADREWIAKFRRIEPFRMELTEVNHRHPLVKLAGRAFSMKARKGAGRRKRRSPDLDLLHPDNINDTVGYCTVLPTLLHDRRMMSWYRPGAFEPLARFLIALRWSLETNLGRLDYVAGIRTMPERRIDGAQGSSSWNVLLRETELRAKVNNWLRGKDHLNTPYEFRVRSMVDADLVQQLLASPSGQRMLKRQIKENLADLVSQAKKEMFILDTHSGLSLSHKDVGLGIGQVIPVLVEAIASESRISCLEQPELHLHPALQAELGDLFIESALGPNKNTFLLETHSEHLILRILRRVRETTEGTLPAGLPPVRPEDVSVVYVQPGPEGAEVLGLPVTPDGDFDRPWPGGFFAERFEELP